MWDAVISRDGSYDGVFVVAVKTTGVFCRPTCPARKPNRENVVFHASPDDALAAGFRPCRRCRPLRPSGDPPLWSRSLLDAVEEDPSRRWRDRDIRELGLDPVRVRRWFRRHRGTTFHGYLRERRLGSALAAMRDGRPILDAGLDHGWESASGFRDAFTRLTGAPPGRGRLRRPLYLSTLSTPLGPMVMAALDEGVAMLEFADRGTLDAEVARTIDRTSATLVHGRNVHLDTIETQIGEFFDRRRRAFDVPLVIKGTAFEEACWAWLLTIPPGATRTYADGAAGVGRPRGARAFGRAIGANRLAIVVPCHRVVGSDGRPTGYGGGVWRKLFLLDIEARPDEFVPQHPSRAMPRVASIPGGGCSI